MKEAWLATNSVAAAVVVVVVLVADAAAALAWDETPYVDAVVPQSACSEPAPPFALEGKI